MIFTNEICVIQDYISRNLIGAGELRGGVYCFKKSTNVKVQANPVAFLVLWHSRLGHPSSQVLSMLPKGLGVSTSYSNDKENPCDVCLCEKQTRNQFNVSESNASNLFEIIHCDIWGSYRIPLFFGAHYFLTIVDDASRAV